ncbi:SidA/IucD/PvdA family monooxygenase [Bacillus sp. JJ1474]|uniref:SidA/IucD/PvdA family monooxygenase n=1 Tax=Bacillus sp. JJ1474 TaxID=3122955 RepID=UPI002FFE5184
MITLTPGLIIPAFSKELQDDVIQLHSSQYKKPKQLKEGNVLVVGGGNSGAQIAVELSESHPTYLSAGEALRFFPLTFTNKSIFWWLDQLGILKANSSSKIAKWLRKKGDPIFGLELKEKIKLGKVSMKGRTIGIKQNEILFADDSTLKADNIIWATGFETNFSMLDFPQIFDEKGKVIHERGISNIDGLYFLGLPWQHRRGSALLLGVGDDAKFLFENIIMDYSLN